MIRRFAIEHDSLAKIGALIPTEIDPKIIGALRGIQPITIDLGFASAVQSAQKQLEEAMSLLGGVAEAFAKFEQQHRDAQKAILATLAGPLGDIARTGQWASVLGAVETPNVARLFSEKVSAAVSDISASMLGSFSQAAVLDQAKMSAMLGLSGRFGAVGFYPAQNVGDRRH